MLTARQILGMSPKWIVRSVSLEIATTDWTRLRGPRIKDVRHGEYGTLHYECHPWWPPTSGDRIYMLCWFDDKDGTEFHRAVILPQVVADSSKPLVVRGTIHLSPETGAISNPNIECSTPE